MVSLNISVGGVIMFFSYKYHHTHRGFLYKTSMFIHHKKHHPTYHRNRRNLIVRGNSSQLYICNTTWAKYVLRKKISKGSPYQGLPSPGHEM